jgi:hypothetical protein
MGSMADDDERVEQEHEPDRSRCPICGEPEVGRRRPSPSGDSGFNDPDEPALMAFCAQGHQWWPRGTAHSA